MNILKRILRILFIIFLIIIPIGLILCNMFFDLFGYIIIVNNKNKEEINNIISADGIDAFQSKFIIINTEPEDDKVKIISESFKMKEIVLDSESKLIKYAEEEGIDVYDTVTKLNYIYVIALAVFIFFRKLFENVDMFGKFEEKDN